MNVICGWCGVGLTLVSLQVQGEALTITSQRCAVNTWAEVSPVPVTTVYLDEDSAENQTLTNQSQSCLSITNFGLTSLAAQATVDFHRTNVLTATEFRFAHRFQMESQSTLPVESELRLRGFAAAAVSFRLEVSTPVAYQISGTNQLSPVLPGSGYFSIARVGSQALVALTWSAGIQGPPQAQGHLPVGVYDIQFSEYAQADGTVFPGFENLVGGTAGTGLTLTMVPEIVGPPPRPVLQISQINNRVQLTMTNLQSGTFYLIRRGNDLADQPWSVVANFIAGSSTAGWSEAIQPTASQVFYRLEY